MLAEAGNIYTANTDSNNVSKITPQGFSSILASTGAGPGGIVADVAGNIYTANRGSNNVTKITPDPTPAKPAVVWPSVEKAKTKTITALIAPVAGVSYTLTASSGKKLKKGSCKNVIIKQGKKRVARRSCTIKLSKGKWLVSITPTQGSMIGTASRKTYSFK